MGKTDEARNLGLIVLNKSQQANMPLMKVQALQLLTEAEEKSGHIDKAFYYQKKLIQVSDSIKKEKVQRHSWAEHLQSGIVY